MGQPFWEQTTPEGNVAAYIRRLEARIRALETRTIYLPFLDTDPDPNTAGNFWMYNDNRLRIRKPDGTIREIVTTAPAGGGSGTPLPPPPAQPKTRSTTWAAAWSQPYRQNGAKRTDSNRLFVGYADSFNGRQTALVGMPTSVQSTLAGSTINKVEVWLYCLHAYWNNGMTCYFGTSTNTSEPGSLPGLSHSQKASATFKGADKGGGGKWVTLPNSFGQWFRDGSAKALALQAPSSSSTYYGYFGGVGSGSPVPQMRITYTK
jgi:hypothetical protein